MLAASSSNAATLVGQIASKISSHNVLLSSGAGGQGASASAAASFQPSLFSSSSSSSSASSSDPSSTFVKLPAHSSDPSDVLLRIAKEQVAASAGGVIARPISLYTSADPSVLSTIVTSTSFKSLLAFPILLNVTTNGDHANLLNLFKSTGAVILYSASAEEAQKNTLLASKIAINASRLVLHFFEGETTEGKRLDNLPELDKFLSYGAKINGHVNGATNGLTNGTAATNGHSNGHATTGNEDEDNLPSRHHSLQSAIDEAYEVAQVNDLGLGPSHYAGPEKPVKFVIALGASVSLSSLAASLDTTSTGILSISLYRPLSPSALLKLIPQSVKSIVVLEQAYTKVTRWAPLYMDVLSAFNSVQETPRAIPVISTAILGAVGTATAQEASRAVAALFDKPSAPADATVIGQLPKSLEYPASTPSVPKHELAYHKVLSQVFPDRLSVLNDLNSPSPSLAVGKFLASPQSKDGRANWIIGSDSWSYDTGLAGLQTLLSTGVNCNILIVDTSPYPAPKTLQRKKDVGLYALNYGNAYVASVAVYGDYSQTVRAIVEAEKFNGPSVVMAYLPGGEDDSLAALDVLKSTKKAMDSGYWGLYRFDPSQSDENERFQLDSVRIKKDLQDFLDRQNLLTQLANRLPSYDIPAISLGKQAQLDKQTQAKEAYEKLSGALASGPSLLILYASDGGTAEKLAKKFAGRAISRGVNARLVVMDEFGGENFESLKEQKEDNVVLITSTAGQGEFPLNGRLFWKSVSGAKVADNAPNGSDGGWSLLKFAVFGLGDSHYWPRPEDAGYYNKPAKDLDKKFANDLHATRLVDELGMGDDQDADGYMTGYKVWEKKVWQALGVAGVEVVEAEPEPITNEHIKIASNYLRGTIKEGLEDTSTGALAETDGQLTKFHGIYQQDDRDIREERTAAGLEPAYSFMVRVRMPAGVCSPQQWLAIDEISSRRGNDTFKLTTRQTFQFHGIIKANLKPAIQEINKAMLDTIAACGDVNRNVMCSCNPSLGPLHAEIAEFAKNVSEHLMPRTNAYAEIWLDKKMVAGDAVKDVEPLYGPYYLPRKFKIAIAVPPTNDTDVFCQ